MPDYSKMSNKELFQLAQNKPAAEVNSDYSKMSNKELFQLAQNKLVDDKAGAEAPRVGKAPKEQFVKPFPNIIENAFEFAAPVVSPILTYIDKYTGAPIRAAVGTLQKPDTNLYDAMSSARKQFGADPSKAPTNSELAANAGFSSEKHEVPIPWQRFYAPEDRTKVSAADVAGGVLSLGTQPLNLIGIGKGPKAAAATAEASLPLVEKAYTGVLDAAAPKVARVLAPIEEKSVKEYLKRPTEINKFKDIGIEDLKNQLDSAVQTITKQKDELTSAVSQQEGKLSDLYKRTKLELSKEVTPLNQAKEVMAAIEGEKAFLSSLSEQADDALVRSGAHFEKSDLLRAIDKVGESQGKHVIGEAATSALNKMYATREKIVGGLPDVIDAPTMRDVLQQLREDINFNSQAGQFNTSLQKMQKSFTSGISNALKDAAPEYAEYMKRMHDLSQSLSKMSDLFGTESKALSSLEGMRKSGASSQVTREILENYAKTSGRKDLLEKINASKSRFDLLKKMKEKDISQELFPDEFLKLGELKKLEADINAKWEGVSRLTPQSTQAIVQNQMNRKLPSIEDRKALENLSKLTGKDFLKDIQDKSVLNAFSKEGTHGSRLTAAGGAIGAYIGRELGTPFLGAAAGAATGATADKYAGQWIKKGLDVGLKGQEKLRAMQRRMEKKK